MHTPQDKPTADVAGLYADRPLSSELGEHYLRHVEAMTAEGLHSKSAIAGELAHRDMQIERLAARVAELEAAVDAEREACAQLLYAAAERTVPAGARRSNETDRHTADVLVRYGDAIRQRAGRGGA